MEDKINAVASCEMFRRLHILKFGAALVTYLGVQLILHELETIRYMEQIRSAAIHQNDFRSLSNTPETQKQFYDFETVIVILVKHNPEELAKLLKSLEKSKNIEKSLIIFSHEYYQEKVDYLIQGINFAKYDQLYFQYGIQSKNAGNVADIKSARLQSKHHWWWTLNQIFENMPSKRTVLNIYAQRPRYH